MKKTIILAVMSILLSLPTMAQRGYGYGPGPRVHTVSRHGNEYIFAYSVMCAGLFVFFCAVFALFRTSMLRADN